MKGQAGSFFSHLRPKPHPKASLGSAGGEGGRGGGWHWGSGALSPDEVRATVEAVLRRLVDDVQLWHLMQDIDDDV